MNEEEERSGDSIDGIVSGFFTKALNTIPPPFMKLLVVFVVALLLCVYLFKDSINPTLCFLGLAFVLIVFAFLAGALDYVSKKLDYSEQTKEELKGQLRETWTELAEERSRSRDGERAKHRV